MGFLTLLKMSRLHYVRGTPQEAKNVHQANMSSNKYRPGKGSHSWYSEHAAPGYDSFQQYKNVRGFQMNWGWLLWKESSHKSWNLTAENYVFWLTTLQKETDQKFSNFETQLSKLTHFNYSGKSLIRNFRMLLLKSTC